jgi:hypothetical protein
MHTNFYRSIDYFFYLYITTTCHSQVLRLHVAAMLSNPKMWQKKLQLADVVCRRAASEIQFRELRNTLLLRNNPRQALKLRRATVSRLLPVKVPDRYNT